MREKSSSSVRVFYPKLSRAEVVFRIRGGLPHLAERLPVVRVVLFGSYAHGRYTAASDVDLLVVYRGDNRPDAYRLVKETIDVPRLEPHVYTEADYEGLGDTISKMVEGGVVLLSDRAPCANDC